ncbi:hypothetical protein BFJ67_g17996, partial [Fusarium oxysporum f. sp. cepae]
LNVFFPPLPTDIEEEGPRPRRREVAMPNLTMEEVEEKVIEAKAWKAPGQDGLPAMRTAKIIPLKKPNKGDYKIAKAWRPISLLSTLGKILETVVADHISHAAETYGLLPTNHFGARKRRSAEQALLLFQEQVYKAWRNRKVVSLVSFDVKGAYNGVFKDRLLQRLEARGIPKGLIRWIDAFCSYHTATITVTGPTAKDNREGIQAIIDRALDWERRSRATFECDKATIVHFTRVIDHTSRIPFTIKGDVIKLKRKAKILGVIMDAGLRFKKHMAEAATRGLTAAICLRRLRMLSPRTARQLFTATVAPAIDYASVV